MASHLLCQDVVEVRPFARKPMIEHDILNTGEEDTREQGDFFVLLSKRPLGELWAVMNTPRPVDFRAVRLVCSIFFFGYLLAAILRTHWDTPLNVVALRLTVLAYAGFGIYLGRPQTTWRMLRTYVLILALAVPLLTAYLSSSQSDPNTVLSLTSLVTFASLLFVLTPVDLVVTGSFLGAVFLAVAWSGLTSIPPVTATVVLTGTLGAGMALSLVLAMYRTEMNERVIWWRASCGRERALREFAEIATAQGPGLEVLLDNFLEIFGGAPMTVGRCLAMGSGERREIVSTSGFTDADLAPAEFSELPVELQSCAIAAERTLEPIVSHGGARPVRESLARFDVASVRYVSRLADRHRGERVRGRAARPNIRGAHRERGPPSAARDQRFSSESLSDAPI